MLKIIGFSLIEVLIKSKVPSAIILLKELDLDKVLIESKKLNKLKKMLDKKIVMKSYIGVGQKYIWESRVVYYSLLIEVSYEINKYTLKVAKEIGTCRST